MDWPQILMALLTLGVIGDIIAHIFLPYRRRLDNASALDAETKIRTAVMEGFEARIKSLHETIDANNATIKEQSETIASLNHALDDKTLQIRNLTQKVWQAEGETNRVNELYASALTRIAELERENGDIKVEREYYKSWRCEWPDCQDPRGRRPPNNKLKGQVFSPPEMDSQSKT